MSNLFVFGSRSVTVIPKPVIEYLETISINAATIFLGDANGADKAFQKYFLSKSFENVVVYTSLPEARNNFGNWDVNYVEPHKGGKGHEIHQSKDIAAAQEADAGIALWDKESVGTLLSALVIVLNGGTVKIWVHDGSERFESFGDTDGFYAFVEAENPEALGKLLGRFEKLRNKSPRFTQGELFY